MLWNLFCPKNMDMGHALLKAFISTQYRLATFARTWTHAVGSPPYPDRRFLARPFKKDALFDFFASDILVAKSSTRYAEATVFGSIEVHLTPIFEIS
jgi:hypothetical protein